MKTFQSVIDIVAIQVTAEGLTHRDALPQFFEPIEVIVWKRAQPRNYLPEMIVDSQIH